ncbi:MAG: hypothetical protein ACC608_07840 [Anaerofustis sp.]
MSGLIIELQKEAIDQESDILMLLRKAYIAARKLKLPEFQKWIEYELNGYSEGEKIPDYREVSGDVTAWNPYHGWIPVVINDEVAENKFKRTKLPDAISLLINIDNNAKNQRAIINFFAKANDLLSKACDIETNYRLEIDTNQINSIIEKVRNIILDWAITLEENDITGEDLQFSDSEKEIAKSTAIINNYTNNFYGSVESTQIQQDSASSSQEQK